MDFLKNQFARLQQQFNQLTASQKMLSLALMAIMGMTLVWWGHYAGQAEMEPILDQDFTAEDFSRITLDLRARGIQFTPSGSRILVPADRKYEILGDLIYQNKLPPDTSSALMESAGKSGNVFESADAQRDHRNDAKQAMLAAIIGKFPNVHSAMVVIDATVKRSFSNPITARAAVSLIMKPGTKADARLVKAVADFVGGAVGGLNPSDVRVIVDGTSRFFPGEDGGDVALGASSWMDAVCDAESRFARKVCEQLSFCDNVMVHVTVQRKDESSETTQKVIDPKGVIVKETENETETHNNGTASRPTGDVGVAPNTGSNQGMTLGGSDGQSSVMEKQRSKSQVIVPETLRVTKSPAGSFVVASASVSLPRSYFIKTYKAETHSDKEPGEAVLEPYVQRNLDNLRGTIQGCLNLQSDKAIVVNAYTDLVPSTSENVAQTSSAVSQMVGNHGKEIALGALALVSLFMVSTMVRKGGSVLAMPGGAINSAAGSTVDSLLGKTAAARAAAQVVREDAAEVGEAGQTLDGVELDEETVHAQQVVEQVSTLVKENPDVAASLVKRWLNRA